MRDSSRAGAQETFGSTMAQSPEPAEAARRQGLIEPSGRFLVLASLPGNSVELALAAWRGGADGLKVHLNVAHRASGIVFSGWSEEKDRIAAIQDAVPLPVGIMAGADPEKVRADLPHLVGRGFAFIDAYAHDLPAEVIVDPPAPLMVALDHRAGQQEAATYSAMPHVAWLEASIIDPAEYGKPLTVADLGRYQRIVQSSRRPVIVPAQKRLVRQDLHALAEVGVAGVLLGAVVFGDEPGRIEAAVREFKAEAERIGPGAAAAAQSTEGRRSP